MSIISFSDNPDSFRRYRIATPWGDWQAAFTSAGLRELRLPGTVKPKSKKTILPRLERQEGPLGRAILRALLQRLQGKGTALPWSAFDLEGHPPFYRKAWSSLYAIPFGEVRTYGEIARASGSPLAVRATGQACGANPIVLFIPCHRVIAANGPGGFGCGLAWKEKLLALEQVNWPGQKRSHKRKVRSEK